MTALDLQESIGNRIQELTSPIRQRGTMKHAFITCLLASVTFAAPKPPDYGKVADLIEAGEMHKLVRILGKAKQWPEELQGIRKACRTQATSSIKTHNAFGGGVIKAPVQVGPHSVDNEPRPSNTAKLSGNPCEDLKRVCREIVRLGIVPDAE